MEKKEKNVYVSGNIVVCPYPSFDALGEFYLRAKKEGLWENFFHEWKSPPELPQFLEWASEQGSTLFGVFRTPQLTLMGIGKVGVPVTVMPGFSKAESGIIFSREYQVRNITIEGSRMMLEMAFDLLSVNVLFASIPSPNRASVRFMKAIGFEYLTAEIPHYTVFQGEPCGVHVGWLSREHWADITPFRF